MPTSIANLTDLLGHRATGKLTEHEEYWCIKSPSRPDFFWGNYLIMKNAPYKGCYERWMAFYAAEHGYPENGFCAITWDNSDPGDPREFVEKGFELSKLPVLAGTIEDIQKPRGSHSGFEIRALNAELDWVQYLEVHVPEGPSTPAFIKSQRDSFRKEVDAGRAIRYGAFKEGVLVSDLGMMFGKGFGRFHNVGTHPAHRKQGACSSLVYESSLLGFTKHQMKQLVILADSGTSAERIYRSIGYQEVGLQWQLQWYAED